ncbi:hypothetical protein K435DRAFT_966838 [Dendrothele bispora CBS 962.96]|uniref:Uncharacterized protein n=1 Tax=Dendrothele bispora (strain CBS 962.96) TaxID=1314807 RepID=A0A4S8LXP2_DENBC|nr:hypothetical protein K435DRAFT_966838 [Dendrothele bispora CBS 962.96]
MSKVVLPEGKADERIVLPSPADKLPPNPLLLGREPTSAAASSQRSSIASVDIPKEDKTLRNKLLKTDQWSFLTGVVSVDLQPAHILNTIRKATTGSEADVRKKEVEKLLNLQRILGIGKRFDLDCICNAFLLEANQHVWLDLYGAIAFIPIESQLDKILKLLNFANEIWQLEVEEYGTSRLSDRPLDITMEPQWQVLVLHPEAVCAERHPIRIRRHPYVFPADNPTKVHGSDPIIWDDYLPEDFILQRSSDGRKRVFVHGYTDENFQLPTRRKADEQISILAMIINASSKLEHAIEKKYPCYQNPSIVNLRNKCSDICRQFFFQPKLTGVHMKDGSSSSVQDRTPTPTQASKGLFSSEPGSSSTDTANSGADGSSDVNIMQGDEETFILSTSSSISSTADDGKVDGALGQDRMEVPAEDGLTNTEFRILSNKAVDPNLSAEERSRSAMLLLFGTQPYKVPGPSPF